MTARPLVLVGGGEHARVVIDAARDAGGWQIVGYADVAPRPGTDALGALYLGSDEDLLSRLPDAELIMALGGFGPEPRRTLAARYAAAGARWAVIVHRAAFVSPTARLGPGVVVLAGAVVNTAARVGDHCIINSGAVVEHDVCLGALVHVAPGAVIGGGARIGEGAGLGLGCRVRDHVTVGPGATVGMGAVVVADVSARDTVLGVPAAPRTKAR